VITVLTARRFLGQPGSSAAARRRALTLRQRSSARPTPSADIGAARQARRFIAAYRIGLADCAPQDYAQPEQESDLFF
jgi:hypothetical protein